jgi:hypothetical protein
MVDITGKKRGSLTATSTTGVKCNNGDYKWNFLCDCGNTHVMSLGNFGSKEFPCCKKCGRERGAKAHRTHGFKNNHKVYKAWCKIKERCYNKNSKDYPTYGARGIQLDEPFKSDFMSFYNEIGEPPDSLQRWSIDRIDHTRGYELGNMRWATDFQQARNKGKSSNNTTGVTGVGWDDKLHPNKKSTTLYAVAQWKIIENGKKKFGKKCFSVKKYGLLPAFAMACAHREQMITELNAQGYGYTENHGK